MRTLCSLSRLPWVTQNVIIFHIYLCPNRCYLKSECCGWEQGHVLPGLLKLEYGRRACMNSWTFDSCKSLSLLPFGLLSRPLPHGLLVFKELRQLWEWLCATTPQSLQSCNKDWSMKSTKFEMFQPTPPVISWHEEGEVPLRVLAPCPRKYQWDLQLLGR